MAGIISMVGIISVAVHKLSSCPRLVARHTTSHKLKIVAEAEAVKNNSGIAREYGISESMVRRWRKDQANLCNGEIKFSAKRKTMGCFTPKYPELDKRILEWFTEQRSQGKFFVEH